MTPMQFVLATGAGVNGPAKVIHFLAMPARLLGAEVPILKGLTWRRVGYTFLVAAAFAFYSAASRWLYLRYGPEPQPVGVAAFFLTQRWGWVSSSIAYSCVFVFQMLAVTVADNCRIPHVPRVLWISVALLAGTVIAVLLLVFASSSSGTVLGTRGARFVFTMTWGLLYGAIMALIYFKRRRDRELALALHDAQMRRVDLQRKTLESHLQVMQAQVEPQFLLNTLQRIGDLYEHDGASANRMLESLIVYLRAALPQMRTTTSTLGQEAQLAQAYLDIERVRRGGRLDFAFDVSERLAGAAFPPMVLLPLIDALLMHGTPNGDPRVATLRLQAHGEAGMLDVTLTGKGSARFDGPAFDAIRDRLAALFGVHGTLYVAPIVPDTAIATLRVPYAA